MVTRAACRPRTAELDQGVAALREALDRLSAARAAFGRARRPDLAALVTAALSAAVQADLAHALAAEASCARDPADWFQE